MNTHRVWRALAGCLLPGLLLGAAELGVRETVESEGVLSGKLDLPGGAPWVLAQPPPASGLADVSLAYPPGAGEPTGRRARLADQQRTVQRSGQASWAFYQPLRRYAEAHDGVGPETLDQIPEAERQALTRLVTRPWWLDKPGDQPRPEAGPDPSAAAAAGPFYFLVPKVRMLQPGPVAAAAPAPAQPPAPGAAAAPAWVPAADAADLPLVIELRPYLDDSQHWVFLANGRADRRAVDPELLRRYGLTVRPVLSAAAAGLAPPAAVTCTIVARRTAAAAGTPVRLTVRQPASGEERTVAWDTATAAAGSEATRAEWARARARTWAYLADTTDAPVLKAWRAAVERQYGAEPGGRPPPPPARDPGRTSSLFGLLGGRAAVRETLQMQVLRPAAGPPPTGAQTPIDQVRGVEVKSHPFAAMLAGREPGQLPLADAVPPDRFALYVAKPAEFLDLLDKGAHFLNLSGGALLHTSIQYDLAAAYLARLGLSESWARTFLRTGLVRDMVLFCPDLFLVDGTDVTAVLRVPQLAPLMPLLGQLGVRGLAGGEPVAVDTAVGTKAWWASQGDRLILSTNEGELRSALGLVARQGQGSLGASDEARCMLSLLPLTERTVAYAYASDPFIRRLVGPATKIGQLRRLQARAEMEALAAGALLYRADGRDGTPTLDRLVALKYVPESFGDSHLQLTDGATPSSATWGSLVRPKSLLDSPVTAATPEEAQAYQTYLDNYNRFWRQYFDPIALRFDTAADGSADLALFVLPLVDNTLYRQFREFLGPGEAAADLAVPVLNPSPVLMFSLNLPDKVWTEMAGDVRDSFFLRAGLDPALFDCLGPSFHLAVLDANPVVSLGSGDLLGIFGADLMRGGRQEMVFIPVLLSVFTRPCRLVVELTDPQQVRRLLTGCQGGFRPPSDRPWDFTARLHRLSGRDAWLYTLELGGIVRLRFGLEIQGRYLVISNVPWSQPVTVVSETRVPGSGARLSLWPAAVRLERNALYTAALDGQRAAAVQGMGYLLPLLLAGCATPEAAAAEHRARFGFAPTHPGTGAWTWQDGRLASSTFGNRGELQPPYDPGDLPFGLLGDLRQVSVTMQFERDGLRSTVHWTRPPPAKP